jgi:hypothetical protein
MRYYILTFLVLIFLAADAHSQRWKRERHHLLFGLGGTSFMGDLGGADDVGSQGITGFRDFNFAASRPAFTFGHRYFLFENLALTNSLSAGYIYGSDQFTNEPFRNNRNIHFRSPILELSGTADLYVVRFQKVGARYRAVTRARAGRGLLASGYLFAGVAGFYFNPQGYFDAGQYIGMIPTEELPADGWYNLRPLSTEGQGYFPTRQKYIPVAFSIPFGLGATIQVTDEYSVGFRFGFRKTFTDYLDDVSTTYVDPAIYSEMFDDPSKIILARHFANPTNNQMAKSVTAPGQQRGNPYNTDTYMFGFLTLTYRFNVGRRIYGTIRY